MIAKTEILPVLKTRAEATARGDKRFFTGVPCRNGHIAERWASSGACRQCIIDRAKSEPGKKWRRAYEKSESFKQKQNEPERKERRQKRERERGNSPHKRTYNRDFRFKKKYGMERGEFELMLELQNHSCAICEVRFAQQVPLSGTRKDTPVVDHCHSTEKVRAILCGTCNSGIGMFSENPELLRKAALYVEKMRVVTGRSGG